MRGKEEYDKDSEGEEKDGYLRKTLEIRGRKRKARREWLFGKEYENKRKKNVNSRGQKEKEIEEK